MKKCTPPRTAASRWLQAKLFERSTA